MLKRRRRWWHPTPVFLPGKSHGRRSLQSAGGHCNPWGCKESDTTEQLHFHFSLSCIGEGNGNPLQCSCWENPRDRGAWWAGRLQSMGSLRVGHDWVTSISLFSFMHWRWKWQPTPVLLLGESQGQGSLVGWGVAQSRTRLKRLSSSSIEKVVHCDFLSFAESSHKSQLPSLTIRNSLKVFNFLSL